MGHDVAQAFLLPPLARLELGEGSLRGPRWPSSGLRSRRSSRAGRSRSPPGWRRSAPRRSVQIVELAALGGLEGVEGLVAPHGVLNDVGRPDRGSLEGRQHRRGPHLAIQTARGAGSPASRPPCRRRSREAEARCPLPRRRRRSPPRPQGRRTLRRPWAEGRPLLRPRGSGRASLGRGGESTEKPSGVGASSATMRLTPLRTSSASLLMHAPRLRRNPSGLVAVRIGRCQGSVVPFVFESGEKGRGDRSRGKADRCYPLAEGQG